MEMMLYRRTHVQQKQSTNLHALIECKSTKDLTCRLSHDLEPEATFANVCLRSNQS
jgi:hypothetical protein